MRCARCAAVRAAEEGVQGPVYVDVSCELQAWAGGVCIFSFSSFKRGVFFNLYSVFLSLFHSPNEDKVWLELHTYTEPRFTFLPRLLQLSSNSA